MQLTVYRDGQQRVVAQAMVHLKPGDMVGGRTIGPDSPEYAALAAEEALKDG